VYESRQSYKQTLINIAMPYSSYGSVVSVFAFDAGPSRLQSHPWTTFKKNFYASWGSIRARPSKYL